MSFKRSPEWSIAKFVSSISSSTGNLFYNENGANAGLDNGGHFTTLSNAPNLLVHIPHPSRNKKDYDIDQD